MNVIEAIHGRRSIRAYRPEPVARTLIEDVIWDAVQAPTPPVSGETPWVICVVEGRQRLADYGARAKQYAREHQPAGQHWAWAERPDFKVFWDAPVAVLFSGRSGNPEAASIAVAPARTCCSRRTPAGSARAGSVRRSPGCAARASAPKWACRPDSTPRWR